VPHGDAVVAARSADRTLAVGEDDAFAGVDRERGRARLRTRALLDEHDLAALIVTSALGEHDQHLERERDRAVAVLVEGVPIAGAIAEEQRGRPALTRRAATGQEAVERRRKVGWIAVQALRPAARDGGERRVQRAAQPRHHRWQRIREVAIATASVAVAAHVDRRAE
jgi:hypothetical protein